MRSLAAKPGAVSESFSVGEGLENGWYFPRTELRSVALLGSGLLLGLGGVSILAAAWYGQWRGLSAPLALVGPLIFEAWRRWDLRRMAAVRVLYEGGPSRATTRTGTKEVARVEAVGSVGPFLTHRACRLRFADGSSLVIDPAWFRFKSGSASTDEKKSRAK